MQKVRKKSPKRDRKTIRKKKAGPIFGEVPKRVPRRVPEDQKEASGGCLRTHRISKRSFGGSLRTTWRRFSSSSSLTLTEIRVALPLAPPYRVLGGRRWPALRPQYAHRAARGGPSPIRPPPCRSGRAGSPGLTRQPYFSRKAVAGSASGGSSNASHCGSLRITADHCGSLRIGAAHIEDFDFSQLSAFFPTFFCNL